jgi:hypothetical protein
MAGVFPVAQAAVLEVREVHHYPEAQQHLGREILAAIISQAALMDRLAAAAVLVVLV